MGALYIVATPIGNLEDITIRAIKILLSVDYVASEDTRNTGNLLQKLKSKIKNQELSIKNLNINHKPQLISYYDEIEFKRVPEIINILEQGKSVALVSDSGTPLISDPGFKLIKECLKQNMKIISIPGPSAVITALTLSGLPVNQFLFLGYLPTTQAKRKKLFDHLSSYWKTSKLIHPTITFFESPHRLKETLIDLKDMFSDIEIVICRELTKLYEEVWRGKITDLPDLSPKGELVVLFNIPQE